MAALRPSSLVRIKFKNTNRFVDENDLILCEGNDFFDSCDLESRWLPPSKMDLLEEYWYPLKGCPAATELLENPENLKFKDCKDANFFISAIKNSYKRIFLPIPELEIIFPDW